MRRGTAAILEVAAQVAFANSSGKFLEPDKVASAAERGCQVGPLIGQFPSQRNAQVAEVDNVEFNLQIRVIEAGWPADNPAYIKRAPADRGVQFLDPEQVIAPGQ